MKIQVDYFCNPCEKAEVREIEVSRLIPASLELRCSFCNRNMLALTVKEIRRFVDYLKSGIELDCDLIIGDVDMPASFVWDDDCRITDAGYQKFKSLMDAPYEVLKNGNIEIFCDDDKLGEKFTYAAAGYIGATDYKLYFEGEWCK
jgi:hypothetical protein